MAWSDEAMRQQPQRERYKTRRGYLAAVDRWLDEHLIPAFVEHESRPLVTDRLTSEPSHTPVDTPADRPSFLERQGWVFSRHRGRRKCCVCGGDVRRPHVRMEHPKHGVRIACVRCTVSDDQHATMPHSIGVATWAYRLAYMDDRLSWPRAVTPYGGQ